MKARALFLLLCGSAALAADYGPPVLETPGEFFAHGDFDGTGRGGYMVIDRASGGIRPATTTTHGSLAMGTPYPSAVTGVTGVAVGRFWSTSRDALAVTSPATNRIKMASPSGLLEDVFPPGIGPRDLAALPLPVGTSGRDGLAVMSVLNSPKGGANRRHLMSNNAGTFDPWVTQALSLLQTPHRSLAVVRQPGDIPRYAELRTVSGDVVFAIHDSQTGTLPVLTSCTGIAPDSRICYANFNPDHPRGIFIFHVPGTGVIQLSALDPGLLLTAPVSHNLGVRLDWVHPAPASDGSMRLIASENGGMNLRVIRFGTTNVPSITQTLAAPAGEAWKGLMPVAGGGWFAASGPPGSSGSTKLQQFLHQGGKVDLFTAGSSYDLLPLRPEELGGDVLLFDGRPFFDNDPVLRAQLRAGGWTSNLVVAPAPSGTVQTSRETWQGPTLGLAASGTSFLGTTPAQVTHGLANQLATDASFYSLDPPIGLLPDAIQFDPPGGPQTTAVRVQLIANDPATTIHYALNDSRNWLTYSDPIGPLTRDTTIHAYASGGGRTTPITSASYTFPADPADLDSDGDGVPDFVEIEYGLDPTDSLGDGDEDGVSDLLEILAGTDPADPDDLPTAAQTLPYTRRFNLTVEPLSHDGSAHGAPLTLLSCLDPDFPTRLRERTRVSIHRPDGTLELEGPARTRRPSSQVALVTSNRIVTSPPPFWVAATPDRFMIAVPSGLDYLHGRGLFRLMDYQATPLDPLPRPELSGTPAEQAAQWVTAVRDHLSNHSLVSAGGPVSYLETLDLLLAEHALGAIFHARGLIPSPQLTLTPARGDVAHGRHALADTWLADLPAATATDPGYDWPSLLAYIRSGIAGIYSRNGLELLAREFYRIGYHAFDDPENPLNLAPFDALRAYLDTGTVPKEYASQLSLPGPALTDAGRYRNAFLSNLPRRDHTPAPLLLTADPGFDREPWIVLTSSGGTDYWLATPSGDPFPPPAAIRILEGSRFLVGGHLENHPKSGKILMVDSIQLFDVPIPGWIDTDNNLLGDSWEGFLFGTLGNDPFADDDGDHYSALQEMFELTAPDDPASTPGVAVVDLRPPHLYLTRLAARMFQLDWWWPTAYSDRIGFFVAGTPDFRNDTRLIDHVEGDPGGHYTTPVDATSHPDTYFYRAWMELK